MHLSFLVILLIVLIAAEEIISVVLHHCAEGIVVFAGVLLAIVLFYFGCWAAWDVWEWFRSAVGDTAAHMVADPVCVFIGGFAPFLIWIDSLQDFKRTARFFRWIARRKVVA